MSSPDPVITFYIDRCLGRKLARTLQNLGLNIAIHDEHFPQNSPDVDWLPEVGRRGWVILTKDTRISRNTLERLAVAQNDVRMFALARSDLSGQETIEIFTKAIGAIHRILKQQKSPFIAKIYRDSRIKMYRDRQALINELNRFDNP